MEQVVVRHGATTVLGPIDWTVRADERWVVLGANGAGKTTLLSVVAGSIEATSGYVDLFGESLAADTVDLDALLPLIGWSSAALADQLASTISVEDVLLTGLSASMECRGEVYTDADRQRAHDQLAHVGCRDLVARPWATLSEGERKRVLLARALLPQPEILLLDEPAAGLDLGGREALLRLLARLVRDPGAPATVMVVHHVEEIPIGFTHALLLRAGEVVAAGPIAQTITSRALSSAFGVPIVVSAAEGRFFARMLLPRSG